MLGLSLYDLFLGSLAIFVVLGVLLHRRHRVPEAHVARRCTGSPTGPAAAARASPAGSRGCAPGIDQAHERVLAFNTPRGWLALFWATMLSGPSHANKLLAGYVALRALGIEANFVDVLLVQTLITFLLYFAPTPGASGIAEVLSALGHGVVRAQGADARSTS